MSDPYQAPSADIEVPGQGPTQEIIDVAKGQKLILYAILVNFSTVALQVAVSPIFGVLALVAIVMSIVGIVRMAGGLGFGIVSKILFIIGMIIPLLNLVLLLSLNGRATKALKAEGFEVGLMGAKIP